ncbi:PIG-L family deacetylase [Streptacidiphilus monticola]|uniref:PIG-L family deacetylase n=1 Tax=Streptacidiphilus monticola TaxID=2161674 RepID=A0ABW1GB32_9ACTN
MEKGRGGLLAVHAHPDDESLWSGGVLAQHAAERRATAVLTCTDGELWDGSSLAAPGTRAKELAQALSVLGVRESALLPYRDSGAGEAGPGSLRAAPFEEVVEGIVAYIRAVRPAAVLTYDAHGGYGHPDHVRVHQAVLAAVEAAANPYRHPGAGEPWAVRSLWLATVPESLVRRLTALGLDEPLPSTPDAEISLAVDVRPWLEVKWQALRAHASEFARGARVAAFEEPQLRRLCLGTEWYLHRPGPGSVRRFPAAGRPPLLSDLA